MTDTALVRQDSFTRLDTQALIAQAIESNAGIEMMERLVALAKEVRAEQAREAWYEAMAEFQKTCPSIKKTATAKISTRSGPGYSYRYAPLDEITSTIQPVMGELGLSISWRSRVEPDQVIVSCRVSHVLGHHEESGDIAIPIVQGDGTGATPPQRVGIATTYAKRYSLLGIIGMAPEDDDDAGSAGKAPTPQEPSVAPEPQDPEAFITEGQVRMLSAVATGHKWSDDQLHTLLSGYKVDSRKQVLEKDFNAIVNRLKQGPGAK